MARLGLAVDVGTTNIAGYVVNLDKPKDFRYLSLRNSQTKHGYDVVSRMTFASANEKNPSLLQKLIVNDLNNLIHLVSNELKVNRKRLETIIVSANTVMLHFLFGVDISGINSFPYDSKIKGSVNIKASDIGVVASRNTKIISLPVISPYVGGDVVAGIIYSGMNNVLSKKILLDLGTNAEIAIGNRECIYVTSAAAGPAFKSRNIPFGSDMIAMISKMLKNKEIDNTGRLLIESSVISQQDVRAFQLAKGAVNAGIEILLQRSGGGIDKVNKILLAGLFGEKIYRQDAIDVGLVPRVDKKKIRAIGNSSLEGAKKILLNMKLMETAEKISNEAKHIELSLEHNYQDLFISNINFS